MNSCLKKIQKNAQNDCLVYNLPFPDVSKIRAANLFMKQKLVRGLKTIQKQISQRNTL